MNQTSDQLLDALFDDDLLTFSSLLLKFGWPKSMEWPDHYLLSEAIKFGRKNVTNYLLDLKCRVIKPDCRSTFVHVALTYIGWSDLVVKLIDLGASVSTVNAQGDTAVHVAFKNNADGDLIDLLLEAYVVETMWNIKDSEDLSILHIACSRPNLKIVRALTYHKNRVIVTREDLNKNVKTRRKMKYSHYTPLHFAVKNGRTEIVKFLSQCLHVDVGKVDANSTSPLHLALECGDMEILDCLLAHDKVHADNTNSAGLSHFMIACAGSDSSIAAEYLRLTQHRPWTSLDTLMNSKVSESIDSPYRGYTPLHFAAEFGRLNTVQLLLAYGASCFVLAVGNLTPLIVSLKRGHEKVCFLLWNRYKAYRQALFKFVDKVDRQIVESEGNSPDKVKNQVLEKSLSFSDEEQPFEKVECLDFNGKRGQKAPN